MSLPIGEWLGMTGLILSALVPFAAAGIFLGHKVTAESVGPAVGGGTALLALVSGTWFPVDVRLPARRRPGLPSYWLVQASRVALGGGGWSATGWVVVAGWSVVHDRRWPRAPTGATRTARRVRATTRDGALHLNRRRFTQIVARR